MDRNGDAPYKRKHWLRHHYLLLGMSMEDIGEDCGVSGSTIRHFIVKYKIPKRRSGPPLKVHRAEVSTRVPAWLRDEVKAYAKKNGKYVSDVVKEALMAYLMLEGKDVETQESV